MTVDTLAPIAGDGIDLTHLAEPASVISFDEPLDVLYAEDDRHDQLLLTLASADSDTPVRLTFVDNGAQLLAVLKRRLDEGNRPDIVVLDIRMPRMDGHAVLDAMRFSAEMREVPVVVLSSSTDRGDVVRCYARGVLAYEVKPSRYEELVEFFDRLPQMVEDPLTDE